MNTSQISEHKIIQIGNSLAVTLPSSFAKSRKLKAGQTVFVETSQHADIMEVRTKKSEGTLITAEFYDWLSRFNKRYKNALSELAKK